MTAPIRLVGRMIGIINLNRMIKAVQDEGKGDMALRILRNALRCKGDRDGVLAYAEEVRAGIANWGRKGN